MAVRAQRRRRTPVRSTPKATHQGPGSYERARAAVGLAIFVLFFGFVWLVNGHWTGEGTILIGGSYEGGWTLHLLITAIEVLPVFVMPFVPKGYRWLAVAIWLMALPFGIFDVFSSAIAIMQLVQRFPIPAEWLPLSATIAAEFVAFAPERLGVPLFLLFFRILKG